jgi:hypothetical protein
LPNKSSGHIYIYIRIVKSINNKVNKKVSFCHFAGFKSEEVTVELISGNLHIRGESTRLSNSRFHIETNIPRDCTIDEIRSKFDGGILYITVPTKDPWSSAGERIKGSFSKSEKLLFAGLGILVIVLSIIMIIFVVKITGSQQITTVMGQAASMVQTNV